MSRYLDYFAAARPFTTVIAVTNIVTVILTFTTASQCAELMNEER